MSTSFYFRARPTKNDRDYLLERLRRAGQPERLRGKNLRQAQPDPRPAHRLSGDAAGEIIGPHSRLIRIPASWPTTSPTRTGTPASSATSTRTSPRPRARSTPCSRRRISSRNSSSTARSIRQSTSSAWRNWAMNLGSYRMGGPDPDHRFKTIYPACGSGHFLLGFRRPLDRCAGKSLA